MDIREDTIGTTVIMMVTRITRIQMVDTSGMLMRVVMGMVMGLTVEAVIAVKGIIDVLPGIIVVTEDDVITRLPALVPVRILQTPMIPQIQNPMVLVQVTGITRGM
jgi:hypothetical protein